MAKNHTNNNVGNIEHEPMVSVIVLNYNGQHCIKDCIESLLAQSYTNREFIIVDNGSVDNSLEIIKDFIPRIRVITNSVNVGFTKGNNIGIRAAKGDLISFVNNDTRVHTDWLRHLVNYLKRNAHIGIIMGVIYYEDYPELIWSAGGLVDLLTGMTWHIGKLRRIQELNTNIQPDYIPNCGSVIRKEVLRDVGMLNEKYFLYSEDVDLGYKIKKANYK